ncbi:MAG: TlpA family protein disulfide reductase [Chitinophagaceae bacterium]|nr:TlpA family protein disulfide reductase [Chitinophagaceae bacterium]
MGALLLGCSIVAEAQFSNLQPVDKVKISAGTPIRYTYDPQHTRLRDADSVEVALIVSSLNGFASMDLKAVKKGKLWETEFVLPDTVCALALRFRGDDMTDDNHGNGYIYPIYKKEAPVRGAGIAAAGILLRCRRVLSLGSDYSSRALALYEQEFRNDPSLKVGKELDYYSALVYTKKREVYPVLDKKADSLLKMGFSEKRWALAAGLWQLTGKRAEADSLKDRIRERTGAKTGMGERFWQHFLGLQSADSMLAILQAQMKDQPVGGEKDLSFMAAIALSELAKQGNPDKAWEYLHLLNGNEWKQGTFHQIAKAFLDAGKRLPDADSLLKLAVQLPDIKADQGSYLPPSDLKSSYIQNMAEYYNTYAELRKRQGNVQEAIAFQQKAVQYTGRKNSAYNEALIGYLRMGGQEQALLLEASRFIAAGNGSPSMKEQIKEVFRDKEKLPAYLDSIESLANTKMQRQLEFDMIKKKMPDFQLTKTDGSPVSLGSLKGKVVVLDFWATWCGPCKRSFPAMQMALERYRKDTNVVFLFVNTWESMPAGKRVTAITEFLKKNGYDFQVMLDAPLGTGSRSYQLANALAVEGIPAKYIIDRNGDIRFLSLGFTGDSNRMVAELSNMIGIAMKQ